MPIYEYRCEKCGSRFDVLQRVGDDGKHLRCPKCGHEKVEKQFSAFATSGGAPSIGSSSGGGSCGSGGFS
jgi:putative FmdB family regulatory protein